MLLKMIQIDKVVEDFLKPSCVWETGVNGLPAPANSLLQEGMRICQDERKEDCCYWDDEKDYCGYKTQIYRIRKEGTWKRV
jgi:hypothetical protein